MIRATSQIHRLSSSVSTETIKQLPFAGRDHREGGKENKVIRGDKCIRSSKSSHVRLRELTFVYRNRLRLARGGSQWEYFNISILIEYSIFFSINRLFPS